MSAPKKVNDSTLQYDNILKTIQNNHDESNKQFDSLQTALRSISESSTSTQNMLNNNSTNNTVKIWLEREVKLPQYLTLFNKNGFDDIDSILDITNDDLMDIGIDKMGHRKRLLKCIKNYNYNHNEQENNRIVNMNDILNEIKNQYQEIKQYENENTNNSQYKSRNISNASCIKTIKELINFIETITNPKTENCLNRNSSKLKELKSLIQKQHKNKVSVPAEHKDKYLEIAAKYFQFNPSTPTNPKILMNKNGTSRIMQSTLIEIERINNYQRIPSLNENGQKGLRAKRNIRQNTIIGEYYGNEWMENDIPISYTNSWDHIRMNEYAFGAAVSAKFTKQQIEHFNHIDLMNKSESDCDQEPPKKKQRLNNHNDDEKDLIDWTFNIIVDGLNHPKPSKLIYLNDCKKDISLTFPTDDDLNYKNIELVTCFHNGWPKIVGITCKEIKAGDKLFTDYGFIFHEIQQNKAMFQANLKKNNEKIQGILNRNGVKI